MKQICRKIMSSVAVALIVCMMFSMTAFAATTLSTSGSFGKMNAINGLSVTKCRTFYATETNHTITQVKLFLNVSSGSDPFEVTITSPMGTVYTFYPSTTSNTYTINVFNGEDLRGTWCITIKNLGYSYDPTHIYPATTVTPNLTIYYQ